MPSVLLKGGDGVNQEVEGGGPSTGKGARGQGDRGEGANGSL